MLLLDAGQHEHRVVRGEPEDNRDEEGERVYLDRRRPGIVERAVEPALLEGEHDDPERRRQRERVHEQRLERQDDRAGEHEQQQHGRAGDDRSDHRNVIDQALLLIDEPGRAVQICISGAAGDCELELTTTAKQKELSR